ncbi:unnamed protein product [Linum tenue]|uniref:Gnk2-homologous domain-containing protein n=1 Tax=Linum tenue TaxID=586396 RepID=A0AAV0HNK5_9ROSI|nr:unnamed protein product [Linum tenue]
MGVQVRCLDARIMATLLMWSLIVTMINGGFPGGAIISALNPMCAASNVWFCSVTDFDIPRTAQQKILKSLTTVTKCTAVYEDDNHATGAVPIAYKHSSCADGHDPSNDINCGNCLKRATVLMNKNCPSKDGAQFGTEECCARYEQVNFCGA